MNTEKSGVYELLFSSWPILKKMDSNICIGRLSFVHYLFISWMELVNSWQTLDRIFINILSIFITYKQNFCIYIKDISLSTDQDFSLCVYTAFSMKLWRQFSIIINRCNWKLALRSPTRQPLLENSLFISKDRAA